MQQLESSSEELSKRRTSPDRAGRRKEVTRDKKAGVCFEVMFLQGRLGPARQMATLAWSRREPRPREVVGLGARPWAGSLGHLLSPVLLLCFPCSCWVRRR